MELSQKELPIEKRFALVVRHNKWLMNKNLSLEDEIESYSNLIEKYEELKEEYKLLNKEINFLEQSISKNKTIKLCKRMLQEYGLFDKFLLRLQIGKEKK